MSQCFTFPRDFRLGGGVLYRKCGFIFRGRGMGEKQNHFLIVSMLITLRDTVIAESCCGIGLINSVVQFDVRAVFICQSQNILLRSALQAAVSIARKKYALSTKIW